MTHPFVSKALIAMQEALHAFGFHSYGDKGPQEVMDIDVLVAELRNDFTSQEAGDILTELSRTSWEEDAAQTLAYCLGGSLEGWDELFEHANIEEFYE